MSVARGHRHRLDNFDRQVWSVWGFILGATIASTTTWVIALGAGIGWGGGGLILYGLVSGRIVLRHKEVESDV